jgi:hypothetical protein
VNGWERKFLDKPTPCGLGFFAPIDTTFALYRNAATYLCDVDKTSIRLAAPRVLKHVDWYVTGDRAGAELEHYLATASHEASSMTLIRAHREDPDWYQRVMDETLQTRRVGPMLVEFRTGVQRRRAGK